MIEISKGRSGLGLSIVGGKDTQLVWDNIVYQAYGPLSQFRCTVYILSAPANHGLRPFILAFKYK